MKKLNEIDGIVFDMDGVIFDTEAVSQRRWFEYGDSFGFYNIKEVYPKIIGTNSADSMRSGIIYGTAAMIDGMLERYRGILGADAAVVATGGFAGNIIPFCKDNMPMDPQLILDGLFDICKKNS